MLPPAQTLLHSHFREGCVELAILGIVLLEREGERVGLLCLVVLLLCIGLLCLLRQDLLCHGECLRTTTGQCRGVVKGTLARFQAVALATVHARLLRGGGLRVQPDRRRRGHAEGVANVVDGCLRGAEGCLRGAEGCLRGADGVGIAALARTELALRSELAQRGAHSRSERESERARV